MKSATIPPLRVTPDLRADVESVLKDGETLSNFVEQSVMRNVHHRKMQQEFIARGMAAKANSEKTGKYFTADESLQALDTILEKHNPK